MKTSFVKFILFFVVLAIFFSCNNSANSKANEKRISDSLQKALTNKANNFDITDKPGIIGVYDVPELLTICKLDSAPMKDLSFKVSKAYSVLEEQMNAIAAKINGMPGMITYNNDTTNFVFECVLPIKEMPTKQPKDCNVVILEASQMLIYNFYGPYNRLFLAYNDIKKYTKANNLEQTSPMREFYLSDPMLVKDPAKWHTRIMLPVKKAN